MTKAYYRRYGHEVYSFATDDSGQAYYVDNDEPFDEDNPRPCPQCHQLPTPEGHDACLGTIRGACAACCGHGVEMGYIAWDCSGGGYLQRDWITVKLFGHEFKLVQTTPVTEDGSISAVSDPRFLL